MHLEQRPGGALGVMPSGQTWSRSQSAWGGKEEAFMKHPSSTGLGALSH